MIIPLHEMTKRDEVDINALLAHNLSFVQSILIYGKNSERQIWVKRSIVSSAICTSIPEAYH